MTYGIVLSSSQCPNTKVELYKMKDIPDPLEVGSIMYAMNCTRHDLAYAMSMINQFQKNLREIHQIDVKNILRYLRRTKYIFLVCGGTDERLSVKCYNDALFTTDRDDCKSQSRYMFIVNGGVMSWKRFKQSVVAQSTIEAEYIVASDAA